MSQESPMQLSHKNYIFCCPDEHHRLEALYKLTKKGLK